MSTIHEPQDEINIIQNEVMEIERMISHLQDRRVTLLRKLNNVRSSTRNLPPEALSLIFEYYSTHYPFCPIALFDSPSIFQKRSNMILLTLGHVSSYWRQVAWSTPRLWSSMTATIHETNAIGILGMLKLHLQNVGGLPFNLDFEIESFMREGDRVPLAPSSILDSIADLLYDAQYCGKIRRLQLTDAPAAWIEYVLTRFTHLEHISLSDRSEVEFFSGDKIYLQHLSDIRHVTLIGNNWNFELSWAGITHLTLCSMRSDRCIEMLIKCPNLVEFDIEQPVPGEPLLLPPPNSTITLPHLKELSWPHYPDRVSLAVLRHLRLPTIRKVTWMEGEPGVSAAKTLFRNLPNTLQEVRLEDLSNWTLPWVKKIFSYSTSVQELNVSDPDDASLNAILCTLCPGRDGDGTVFLPSLKHLTLSVYQYRRGSRSELGIEISSRILDICKARFAADPTFQFSFTSKIKVIWGTGVQEELREMVRDGLNLYISPKLPQSED